MKIEAGKYYRTRDGRKTLVSANAESDKNRYPWFCDINTWHALDREGRSCLGATDIDLVSEWTDEPAGPVITETVKRIVPGEYGRVLVLGMHTNGAAVTLRLTAERTGGEHLSDMTESELRAAAATLLEIADALVKP